MQRIAKTLILLSLVLAWSSLPAQNHPFNVIGVSQPLVHHGHPIRASCYFAVDHTCQPLTLVTVHTPDGQRLATELREIHVNPHCNRGNPKVLKVAAQCSPDMPLHRLIVTVNYDYGADRGVTNFNNPLGREIPYGPEQLVPTSASRTAPGSNQTATYDVQVTQTLTPSKELVEE